MFYAPDGEKNLCSLTFYLQQLHSLLITERILERMPQMRLRTELDSGLFIQMGDQSPAALCIGIKSHFIQSPPDGLW